MIQNKNIPQLRFPEFNDEWEHKPLHKYLTESKAENTNLKYDKSQVLSVSGELGIVNQIEHLGRSYAGESVHNYGVVEIGDIVYTKSPLKANPYGIIKLNKGKAGIVSTLYAVYKVKQENAVGDFFDQYFSSDENTNRYLRPLVKKGAKNDMKINNAYVLHDKIFAPSVQEQKRIASFLTIIDNRSAQLKEKKTLLEEYKKGVLQKIFFKEIRFKDEKGEPFTKWEKKKFGEVYSFISTNSYSRDNLNYENGNIKNIHYGDIHTKFQSQFDITIELVPFINSEMPISKFSINSYCNEGDLVIADASEDYADIGKSIELVNLNQEKIVAGLHTIHARPDLSILHIGFGAFLMKSSSVRYQIMIIAQGTKILGISAGRLAEIKLEIPSKKEQTKIANFLSAIDKKINHCQSQIEQNREYKKGLIQKMFV